MSAKTEAADRIASETKPAPVPWERLFLRLAETAHEGICTVDRDRLGVLFLDGRYVDTLRPGLYAFWKGAADARVRARTGNAGCGTAPP